VPVTAGCRVGERHDDDVPDARGDLVIAPRAPVGLPGGVGLDGAYLGRPPGERITGEHGAQRSRSGLPRACHEALSPPGADVRADGRRFRYNVPVGLFVVGVRFRLASPAPPGGDGLRARALLPLALAAEQAGCEAVLIDGDRVPGAPADPFVLLGALAATTSRVLLGCVATAVDERHPAVLAKTVAALDVCCAGRALVCLRPRPVGRSARLDELAEALDVVRLMLNTPAPSFTGQSFAIEGAWNEPRAARATPIPLGVLVPASKGAGSGVAPASPGELAALVAGHADCCFVEVAGGDCTTAAAVAGALAATALPLIALIGVAPDAAPHDVASLAARALDAGCHGVAIDWRVAPPAPLVAALVAAVRRVAAPPG